MTYFQTILNQELDRISTIHASEHTTTNGVRRWYDRIRTRRLLKQFQPAPGLLQTLSRAIASFML